MKLNVYFLPWSKFIDGERNHKMGKQIHSRTRVNLDNSKVEAQIAICYNGAVLRRQEISRRDKEKEPFFKKGSYLTITIDEAQELEFKSSWNMNLNWRKLLEMSIEFAFAKLPAKFEPERSQCEDVVSSEL